jgi:hypothetical protein
MHVSFLHWPLRPFWGAIVIPAPLLSDQLLRLEQALLSLPGWFVWGSMVIKEICDSLSKFIADCIGKAVSDLVAWHMASYALQGAF